MIDDAMIQIPLVLLLTLTMYERFSDNRRCVTTTLLVVWEA